MSVLTSRSLCLSALLSALLTFGASAEIVILESNLNSPEPGAILEEGETLTIPQGGAVMLITELGETRIVKGPYQGPAGEARTTGDESLFATRGRETKVLGAVRAPKWELFDADPGGG